MGDWVGKESALALLGKACTADEEIHFAGRLRLYLHRGNNYFGCGARQCSRTAEPFGGRGRKAGAVQIILNLGTMLRADQFPHGGASLRMTRLVPMQLRRRGVETRLQIPEEAVSQLPGRPLLCFEGVRLQLVL